MDIIKVKELRGLAGSAPAGQQIGSNYDPTGNSTQGRVTVVFRGPWAQATDLARSNVQWLELVEVA